MNQDAAISNYETQLQSIEWKEKRNRIIERDNHSCRTCGIQEAELNKRSRNFILETWTFEQIVNMGVSFLKDVHGKIMLSSKNEDLEKVKLFAQKYDFVLKGKYQNKDVFFPILDTSIAEIKCNKYLFVNRLDIAYSHIDKKEMPESDRSLSAFEVISSNYLKQSLQVHHIRYIKNEPPWNCDDRHLITLCNVCHTAIHKIVNIGVYSKSGIRLSEMNTCDRCNGSGYIEQYSYYLNGICFKCFGDGVVQ